jgi:uncharacterized OB-fold protein
MSAPVPEITDLNRPYWDGLNEGRLLVQWCASCGHTWLPPRPTCPACLAPDAHWRQSNGTGRIISWVVYHRAYADHLEDRIPYDVTLVELDDGVRLLTNVIDSDAGKALRVGARVRLAIEHQEGIALARFRLDKGGEDT